MSDNFCMNPKERYRWILKEMNDFGIECLRDDEVEEMGRYCLLNGSGENAKFFHDEVDRRFKAIAPKKKVSDLTFFCSNAFYDSDVKPRDNREKRAIREVSAVNKLIKEIGERMAKEKAGNKSDSRPF